LGANLLLSQSTLLRLLTFNAGLLELKLAGHTIDEVQYREERLPIISRAVGESGADVVILQEVFKREHCERLVKDLRDIYRYAVRHDNTGRLGVGHGLLILSSYPVSDTGFTLFTKGPRHERLFIRRGFLAATISPWAGTAIRVVNMHTTSGGRLGAEAAATNRFRIAQLRQAHLAVVEHGGPALIGGDLNTGPEASSENYDTFVSWGYQDAVLITPSAGRGPSGDRVTWDPANELVKGSGFEKSPPQRIDHVFLNAGSAAMFDVVGTRLVFGEPAVPVAGKVLTISDHLGLLVELSRR
jgi:endonuclease/exonuclease/phosphatase family metal-dependent hydrolase